MQEQHLNLAISEFTNEGKKVAEIDIFGAIGTNPFSDDEDNNKENVKEQLDSIRNLEVDEIVVNVSSMGGIVDDALVIYDLLRENEATVKTRISGYTASAGTIIAMAGDEVSMSENSLFLIHRARTMAVGSVNDMESVIKNLSKTDERISNIYSNKGGEDQPFYMEWMSKENGNGVWLDADEVKNTLNLIDTIDRQEYRKVAMATPEQIKNLGLPEIPENKVSAEITTSTEFTINARLSDDTKEALNRIENATKQFEELRTSQESVPQNKQEQERRNRKIRINKEF